jgi:hypothetical protein
MSEFQFLSAKYMGTVIYGETSITGSVGTCFGTTTVTSGAGLTDTTTPIILNPGGCAQWVTVIPTRALSQWQIQGIKRLNEILLLPENWDSYGSRPPTRAAADTAMEILTGTDIDYFVAPRVVPISGGGLQLEWECGARSLEVEVLDDGSVEYLTCEDGQACREGRIHAFTEARPLFLWLLSSALRQAAA